VCSVQRGDHMTVIHFHFTAWPDHGVPLQPTSFILFRRKYHSYDTSCSGGPVVVHCSAGVGRTGTFIALEYLLEQAKSEGKVDVLGCIYKIRESRVNMVQTPVTLLFAW
jgi:protein tyrosine phosphatase